MAHSHQKTSVLPNGEHYYEDIVRDWRKGHYDFAQARSASGRLHIIIGVSPQQWQLLKSLALKYEVGLIILGSRAVGPRIIQRTYHRELEKSLRLTETTRRASAVYPGINGVVIHKTTIKELGIDNPLTSDLSFFVIDPRRSSEEHAQVAVHIENQIKNDFNLSFPVRVFCNLKGHYFRTENDAIVQGVRLLKTYMENPASCDDAQLTQAYRELYIPLNLSRPWLERRDWINASIVAVTASISFSLALPYHPIITLVGFLFGLLGRYIARLKATIVFLGDDSVLSNTFALLIDACIGILVMAAVINPLAGYGIGLPKIIINSLGHTLSRGSLRLVVDKFVYNKTSRAQAHGVIVNTLLSLIQGLVTSYVYAGHHLAYIVQTISGVIGALLLFQISIKNFFSKELQSFHRK